MPLDECSAAMGFQVGFKGVGFFFVFKSNGVFNAPGFEFGGMRDITFIVFFKARFQVFGTADIEMGSGGFINEYVNVVEVRHQAGIFQNNVCGSAVPCCPASSASQITPRHPSTRRLRASHFAVPSVFARLRHWLAEAKSRLCRDEDWWA